MNHSGLRPLWYIHARHNSQPWCISRYTMVERRLFLNYNVHKIHNQRANIVKINLVVRLVLEMVRLGSGTLSPRNGTLSPGSLRQWYASTIIRSDHGI